MSFAPNDGASPQRTAAPRVIRGAHDVAAIGRTSANIESQGARLPNSYP